MGQTSQWGRAVAAWPLFSGWALLLLGVAHPLARADILHLVSGGTVEGDILESGPQGYKVRTVVGTVTLALDAVERVEPTPSRFEEYDRRRAAVGDTPAEHAALAEWCRAQGLMIQRRWHLSRALQLDGDYGPARRALGYVRVGDFWVEGQTLVERPPGNKQTPADGAPDLRDQEQLARAIQTQWSRRIRAIKANLLDSPLERFVEEGRKRVREIRDPLAILPLTRTLSAGKRLCRELLVEMLSRFPQDEATMNLAVMALLDRDEPIRRDALAQLARRNDPRVGPQFRQALHSNSDEMVRRAAVALGMVGYQPAVPDLIAVLTVRRRKWVEVPVRRYLQSLPGVFHGRTSVALGTRGGASSRPIIGVVHTVAGLNTQTEMRMQNVTVYRTEVMETLKRLTGENFGFDAAAWRRWYQEQQQ